MEKQFSLRLFYGKPGNSVVFVGAILIAVVIGPKAVSSLGIDWSLGISFVWVTLVMAGLWWYFKRQVTSFTVLVDTDHLTVMRQGANVMTKVPFAEVVKYRYMVTRGVHWLLFTMNDGQKITICGNSNYGEIGDFSAMVQAIELVAKTYQDQSPSIMVRDKSFF